MVLNVYTDGASRNNPGKSASGYRILDSDGNVLLEKAFYNGIKTNNEAEYLAIIGALESVAHEYAYEVELNIYSDSKLMINQLNGEFKVKSPQMKKLNADATSMLKKFQAYHLFNVPRENPGIVAVDSALNNLLDRQKD